MSSKTINTLVADIEALFNNGAVITEEALQTFQLEVGNNLSERFQDYSKERKPYLRLSSVGRPLRQLWFEVRSGLKAEPLTPASKLKFMYGDLIEDMMVLLAIEAGHTVTDLQRKVEVDGVKGSIDCLIDGILVDIKSASTYSFQKFKDGSVRTNDPFGYVGQLAAYSRAVGGIDAAFLVVDKTLGHIHLERFSKEELAEYDIVGRIQRAREVLDRDVPPEEFCYQPVPEGKSGNLKLPVGCSYCNWKFHCHKDSNNGEGLKVYSYSTGPVYLTDVKKEPRVQKYDVFPMKAMN